MENVVLLDDIGRSRGVADKVEVHHGDTPLHLAFSCYVFNPAGQFLLTRRAESKRVFPGVWTNSCCGHPAPGEAMPDAVRRRLAQELGITVPSVTLVLPRFRYRAELDGIVENELCPVYTVGWDGPVNPDPAEVADAKWVDWADFCKRVHTGQQPISPWCGLQLGELERLGGRPLTWPAGDAAELPPAARTLSTRRTVDMWTSLWRVWITSAGPWPRASGGHRVAVQELLRTSPKRHPQSGRVRGCWPP